LCLAVAITLPWRGLVGHPEIDVWNHAWGYWWVADALGHGALPWHTARLGAPNGGVLWYVDMVGALTQLPTTWTLGPAAAYNAAIVGRVALAGLGAHLLCERLYGRGTHALVAGVGLVTAPMLLCEVHNGISEVVAIYWVAFGLLAAARALGVGEATAPPRLRDFVLLGLVGGLTTAASFYYGLTLALLVAGWVLSRARRLDAGAWGGLALAAIVALAVGLPALLALRASIADPEALIRRSGALNTALAAHNAVDPRVYLTPGTFWSVDLLARYGEPFRHTGYLRWTAVVLATVTVARRPREAAPWVAMAAASLVLGLGPYLWWNEDWVRVGGKLLSLPFGWMQKLVPELAITHPLRLSVGAQVIVAVLAGGALRGRPAGWAALAALLLALETALGSVAVWPIPASPTAVPSIYAEIAEDVDARAVLDLPAEVGTGMATSRYFWFQTVHHHPIPYTPDARAGSTGDAETFGALPSSMASPEREPPPTPALRPPQIEHLRAVYGWIVLHTDLDARTGRPGQLEPWLTAALGAPTKGDGDTLVWRLAP